MKSLGILRASLVAALAVVAICVAVPRCEAAQKAKFVRRGPLGFVRVKEVRIEDPALQLRRVPVRIERLDLPPHVFVPSQTIIVR